MKGDEYITQYSKSARKFLKSQDAKTQAQIVEAIDKLPWSGHYHDRRHKRHVSPACPYVPHTVQSGSRQADRYGDRYRQPRRRIQIRRQHNEQQRTDNRITQHV